jgi:hypothetical protein
MPFVAFSLAAGGNARAFLYRAGFAGGSTAALRSQRQRLLRYGARGDRSAQARPMPLRDGRAAGAPARARSARQIEHGEEGVELRRFRHEAVGVKPVRMPRRKLIAASRLREGVQQNREPRSCLRSCRRSGRSAPQVADGACRRRADLRQLRRSGPAVHRCVGLQHRHCLVRVLQHVHYGGEVPLAFARCVARHARL